jgi:hypothetical protein
MATNPAVPFGSSPALGATQQLWLLLPSATTVPMTVQIPITTCEKKNKDTVKNWLQVDTAGRPGRNGIVTAIDYDFDVETEAYHIANATQTSGFSTPGASTVYDLATGVTTVASGTLITPTTGLLIDCLAYIYAMKDQIGTARNVNIVHISPIDLVPMAYNVNILNPQDVGKLDEEMKLKFTMQVNGYPVQWTTGATIGNMVYTALVNPTD